MKKIELTKGAMAIVDDEDYLRLMQHSWAMNPEGLGYAVRKGSKKRGEPRTVQMHREILHAAPGTVIDHINGNGLDNRKENLRFADTQKNAFNKKKPDVDCTSKYKGVLQRKDEDTWIARIKFNDRHIELGEYREETLAAAAYNYASRIMFGAFRRENEAPEIPELPYDLKISVFAKCHAMIMKHGWAVDTPLYRKLTFAFEEETA